MLSFSNLLQRLLSHWLVNGFYPGKSFYSVYFLLFFNIILLSIIFGGSNRPKTLQKGVKLDNSQIQTMQKSSLLPPPPSTHTRSWPWIFRVAQFLPHWLNRLYSLLSLPFTVFIYLGKYLNICSPEKYFGQHLLFLSNAIFHFFLVLPWGALWLNHLPN